MTQYNITVYPFSIEFAPYTTPWAIRLFESKNMHIHHIVAPKGRALEGKDCGEIDQRGTMNILVEEDFEQALADSNTLLIADGDHTKALRDNILAKTQYAISQGKHILCAMSLSKEEKHKLHAACIAHQVQFIYAFEKFSLPESSFLIKTLEHEKLHIPPVPVVVVGEMLAGTNGDDVAIAIWEYFIRQGYQAKMLMPAGSAVLLGAHAINDWFNESADPVDLVRTINYQISLFGYMNSDIIIVRVPGNMIAFNENTCGDFGIHAYMISQAIDIDCFVLCAPYQSVDSILADELKTLLYYRFAIPLDGIHISNGLLDASYLLEHERVSFIRMLLSDVERQIDEHCKDTTVPVFNIFQDAQSIGITLEEKLKNFSVASPVKTSFI